MAISEVTNKIKKTAEVEVGVGPSNVPKNDEEDEKPRTLFVGNVPREVHKREIEEIFGDVGPLKRCYIQYPRDGNEKRKQREDTTVAYVTFALSQDAAKALETLQNTKIGDNRINLKFAKNRNEQVRPQFGVTGLRGNGNDSRGGKFRGNPNFEPLGGGGDAAIQKKPKEPRPKPIKKKSRLIVRNLSFKVTEDKMKEYFEKFGEVKEVNILKKPNGKLVGCAFIQYQNVYQAASAIKELNMKPFLGRPIAIDWALPKEKYQTDEEKQKKSEGGENETIEIKDEPDSEAEDSKQLDLSSDFEHLKEEPMDIDIEEIKEEEDDEGNLKRKKGLKRKSKSDDSSDNDDEENERDSKSGPLFKRQKKLSNDVEEGKTLFLRNLSFDTKEDEMKTFFEKFGDLHYALLCKDSLTEHPKGTGFVKFKLKSAADKCLAEYEEDPSEFKLSGRQFNVAVALSKEKIENRSGLSSSIGTGGEAKENKKKTDMKPKADSRNLYLAREGFIRPGSGAAADVSASDMAKRATLNKVKKQMLKNLNMLISPTRLCVHNLPPKFTDKQLQSLFKKYGGAGAKITEARIMRDMNDLDLDGKGKSKEYGFVNFTEHEHALRALRAVNNNPSVFTPNSRPIVEFSMENRLALRAKEKRALKSKEKNPNVNQKKANKAKKAQESSKKEQESEVDDNEEEEETTPNKSTKQDKKNKKKDRKKNVEEGDKEEEEIEGEEDVEVTAPNYAGLKSKKGVQTLPAFKPKGKITRNSLKQKKTKKTKKVQQERKQREKKIPSKKNLEKVDKTEKIISSYKNKLQSSEGGGQKKKMKKKWFE